MIEHVRSWLGARRLERAYRRRRDRYARICEDRGLRYREEVVRAAARDRLETDGLRSERRAPGQVRTLAFVPLRGWHGHLLNELRLMGPLKNFDYHAEGFTRESLRKGDRSGTEARQELRRKFRAFVERALRDRPYDWLFVYAEAYEFPPDLLRWCREEAGLPVVVMTLDARQSWAGPELDGHRALIVDLAREADLLWTSARVTCEWVLAEGGRPLYLPEGADATFFDAGPPPPKADLPAAFVGARYGRRAAFVERLRDAGIEVRAFGSGWEGGRISDEEMRMVFRRSVVNLGIGWVGHSRRITNVKARDFDVPCAGGGAYLTTFDADLATHYEVGHEIECWADPMEAVERARWLLSCPKEARAMATRARKRTLREHRWVHRFLEVCQALGILEDDRTPADIWALMQEETGPANRKAGGGA